LSAKLLQDMGMENVSHLLTGFGGWKAEGYDVVPYDTWKESKDS
jgi:rhodanese-related sulfurtransferase